MWTEEHRKKYRHTKEQKKEYYKIYYKLNKEKIDKLSREWKRNHPNYKNKQYPGKKMWAIKNREKLRAYRRIWDRKNRLNIKKRLSDAMGASMYFSLRSRKQGYKWEKLVGYDAIDLITHLGKQFTPDMNWGNYGKYWQIDHIIPISYWKYKSFNDEAFKKCWCLSNLRPLEKIENIQKRDKIEGQIPLFFIGARNV